MLKVWTRQTFLACLTLYHTTLTFNDLGQEDFVNIVGKGENVGNQHFLLFLQCFLLYQEQKSSF